jgi:outer membrane biosynthesis protein TonB
MESRREQVSGWAGSVAFHGALGLLLFFVPFGTGLEEPEYLELSWGSSAQGFAMPDAAPEAAAAGDAAAPTAPETRSLPMSLPAMRSGDNEVLRTPKENKLDAAESPLAARPTRKPDENLKRDRPQSTSPASQTGQPTSGKTGTGGTGMESQGPGGGGTGVSFGLEWPEGGTRKKISGNLPAYPPGVNVEAQIRLETVVGPDGSVRSVRPVQKGNAKLEEAAMKEVWFWKFEPLRLTSRQQDQTCYIVFNFRLR